MLLLMSLLQQEEITFNEILPLGGSQLHGLHPDHVEGDRALSGISSAFVLTFVAYERAFDRAATDALLSALADQRVERVIYTLLFLEAIGDNIVAVAPEGQRKFTDSFKQKRSVP
ncbi:hypothetical protein RB195_011780 [Necator americanus]|uniref:Uncharacterized protein n=1 Tax=Necator americanus TaxID=51031 RepID=A0ABR1D406_NECAM